MPWTSIGTYLFFGSIAASAVLSIWIAVRILGLLRRFDSIAGKRPFRALSALSAQAERIRVSTQTLQSLGERLDGVIGEILAASEVSARLAADVSLAAAATEELLDTLIPSMRGSAAI